MQETTKHKMNNLKTSLNNLQNILREQATELKVKIPLEIITLKGFINVYQQDHMSRGLLYHIILLLTHSLRKTGDFSH